MTTQEKQKKIKSLVVDMLNYSHKAMVEKIDAALNSGAVDIDSWDEKNAPMILPKCIVTALLQRESNQYEGKGTSYEKKIKKEISNLKYYI